MLTAMFCKCKANPSYHGDHTDSYSRLQMGGSGFNWQAHTRRLRRPQPLTKRHSAGGDCDGGLIREDACSPVPVGDPVVQRSGEVPTNSFSSAFPSARGHTGKHPRSISIFIDAVRCSLII